MVAEVKLVNISRDRPVSIEWTPEMLDRFKVAREECEGTTFVFDGNEFDEGYARHLIEYLEGRFGSGE